ncbi:type II secretion system F family protein [Streptomyces zingiberis]|uniref:Type II secretion system protein GspF domain-containing protein n=1 Tax=Streptomyces zingiberis TaxID=2053010 RepID=A0ABX1BTG1_9ACTN|nr:type II secretion system F family protein [Streptomyces zingiberis]NJP99061.1 hypothetical protein [Streptomyces zingiberis]
MSAVFVHSLWTVVPAAGVIIAWPALHGARRARAARRRLSLLLGGDGAVNGPGRTILGHAVSRRGASPDGGRAGPRTPSRWSRLFRDWCPPAGAGLVTATVVGGLTGWVVGLLAALAVRRWMRRRPDRATRPDADPVGLSLAADLLAACLAAGAGPREAASAVGESLGGPIGERLTRVAAELRLGGDPEHVWNRLAEVRGAAVLARCLARAQATGVSAAVPVARVAAECRADRTRAGAAAARRAAVLATAPLGLCFLPAFLTVGVAPVLIGLASRLLDGVP